MLYSLAILSSFICLPAKISLQQQQRDRQAYYQVSVATGCAWHAGSSPAAEHDTAGNLSSWWAPWCGSFLVSMVWWLPRPRLPV
jgi:hypothetical protein